MILNGLSRALISSVEHSVQSVTIEGRLVIKCSAINGIFFHLKVSREFIRFCIRHRVNE